MASTSFKPSLSIKIPLAILTIWVAFYSFQATAATSGVSKTAGGWQPIRNLRDPLVVKIAKFAVTEQKITELGFVRVIKGDTQVVAGLKYRLVITVTESGSKPTTLGDYLAIVWQKPGDNNALQLISFDKQIN